MDPYEIILRDGKKVDRMTVAALQLAEKRLGYGLTIVQGSYNAGRVAASAGTHDGGGVVDLMPWDWRRKVIALRAVGFAAWYRPAIPGLWSAHIHAVLIGHPRLAPSAGRQVTDYLDRRNGLKGNGLDTDPGWTDSARFDWGAWVAGIEADEALRRELHEAQKAAGAAGRKPMRRRLQAMRRRVVKSLRARKG